MSIRALLGFTALACTITTAVGQPNFVDLELTNVQLVASPVDDPAHDFYDWPDWSVNDELVFEARLEGQVPIDARWELITSDLGGGNRNTIPFDWNADRGWGIPSFSADGTQIVGHTTRDWERGFVMNADGTNIELLSHPDMTMYDWWTAVLRPAATTDQLIIGGANPLHRMDRTTSSLLWSQASVGIADWSADYSEVITLEYGATVFLDPATGLETRRGNGPKSLHMEDVSADGSRMLYVKNGDLFATIADGLGGFERWGGELVSDFDGHARWSPDGQSIVYSDDGEIWRANVVPEPTAALVLLLAVVLAGQRARHRWG